MKFLVALLLLASSTDAHKLHQKRIADTPKPHLVPDVMSTDRATKWALCDGTNSGRCREAEDFLKKDDFVPPLEDVIHGDKHSKGLLRF